MQEKSVVEKYWDAIRKLSGNTTEWKDLPRDAQQMIMSSINMLITVVDRVK